MKKNKPRIGRKARVRRALLSNRPAPLPPGLYTMQVKAVETISDRKMVLYLQTVGRGKRMTYQQKMDVNAQYGKFSSGTRYV